MYVYARHVARHVPGHVARQAYGVRRTETAYDFSKLKQFQNSNKYQKLIEQKYCIKLVVAANCPKKENGRNPTIKCYRKNWTVTANCGQSTRRSLQRVSSIGSRVSTWYWKYRLPLPEQTSGSPAGEFSGLSASFLLPFFQIVFGRLYL